MRAIGDLTKTTAPRKVRSFQLILGDFVFFLKKNTPSASTASKAPMSGAGSGTTLLR